MPLVVRKSERDDYPHIKALLEGLDDRDKRFLAWGMKRKPTLDAARKGRHCFVATKDGDVVGFMHESGRSGKSSHLEEFVVHPRHRGEGVATAMLKTYHEEFPRTSAKTKPDNEPMKCLLGSFGYRVADPNASNVLLWERG